MVKLQVGFEKRCKGTTFSSHFQIFGKDWKELEKIGRNRKRIITSWDHYVDC